MISKNQYIEILNNGLSTGAGCGATFGTGSTKKEGIKVDTCSNCHPFYTGRQRFAASAGRIEKFNKKYGLNK